MADSPLPIVIADDHGIVRHGLRLLLEAEDDLEALGEASSLWETRGSCASLRRMRSYWLCTCAESSA